MLTLGLQYTIETMGDDGIIGGISIDLFVSNVGLAAHNQKGEQVALFGLPLNPAAKRFIKAISLLGQLDPLNEIVTACANQLIKSCIEELDLRYKGWQDLGKH